MSSASKCKSVNDAEDVDAIDVSPSPRVDARDDIIRARARLGRGLRRGRGRASRHDEPERSTLRRARWMYDDLPPPTAPKAASRDEEENGDDDVDDDGRDVKRARLSTKADEGASGDVDDKAQDDAVVDVRAPAATTTTTDDALRRIAQHLLAGKVRQGVGRAEETAPERR